MMASLARLPLLLALMAVSAGLMLVPAMHALVTGNLYVARVFFYSGLLLGFLTLFLAIAMAANPVSENPRRHLLGLLGVFTLLPVMLAVPLHQALSNTTFLNAYVEMVSSLTTTGASVFDSPGRLPASVHLWRGIVGWLGGLIMWVGAVAILAPMAIGGFEVRAAPGESGSDFASGTGAALPGIHAIQSAGIGARLRLFSMRLAPLYTGLTLVLWVGLLLAGETPLVGLIHAMSTMATSGISPVGGLSGGSAGFAGEIMVAIFFIFAISRLAFAREGRMAESARFWADPEVRLGLAIAGLVSLALFLRHWIGAYEVSEERDVMAGLSALWGILFTVISYLTTTGFESAAWDTAQNWSGLGTQGLVLIGLALIGGGVATTAGGAKLLRVYALYKHSVRELERLVLPSSVGGAGAQARQIRSRGAFRAWIFFMLTALTIAGFLIAFALAGQSFEEAMVLTLAGITTTGQLAAVAMPEAISYGTLEPWPKLIFSAAMIMGRLEMLAIIALFSPDIWRR